MLSAHILDLLDSLPLGLMVVDRGGIILHLNQAGCRLLGVDLSEVRQQHVLRIDPGTNILDVVQSGKASLRTEVRFGGKLLLVDRVPYTEEGKIIGAISVFQDMTPSPEAARRISGQERELHQLRELIEQLYDGLVMCDRNGIVTMINQAYCDFLGTTIEEAIGRPITEVIENTRMPQVMETGQPELGHLMKVGNRDIIVSRVPMREGGRVIGAMGKVIFNDLRELRSLVERCNLMEKKLDYYRQELKRAVGTRYSFDSIFADHHLLRETIHMAKKAASSRSSILILGESGTGKELFAQAIHGVSPRSEGPFVRVNCAAIPKDLMEAELFGYEEGAFTGARKGGSRGKWNWPTAAPCFWMRSAICRWICR